MSSGVGPSEVVLLGTADANGALTGVTTGTGIAQRRPGYGINTVLFQSIGTTSGGTIVIEEARLNQQGVYDGTWSAIQSVSASSFTGDVQLAMHIANSAIPAIRARISSNITGGGKILVFLLSQAGG